MAVGVANGPHRRPMIALPTQPERPNTMTIDLFGEDLADALNSTHVPTAAEVRQQRAHSRASIVAASKALSTDSPITVPNLARDLYPWQQSALTYAVDSIARHGGVVIGDDMGLGKTAVALSLIALWRAAAPASGPVLVITPPANLGGYQRELRDAFPSLRMFVARGRKPVRIPTGTDIVWMSDDSLTMRSWLVNRDDKQADGRVLPVWAPLAGEISGLVIDEVHRHKGNVGRPSTTRSRAATSLHLSELMRATGKPVVVMTGTLTTNRAVDALLPLKIAGGSALVREVAGGTTEHAFLVKYCTGKQTVVGGQVKSSWDGAQNLHELHDNLRATCYVRREKSDLADGALPHFGWAITPIALPSSALAKYRRAADDLLALITEERGVEAAWKAARAETIVRMMRLWREAGTAKASAAADYVSDLIDASDGEDSVVVFYQHEDVVDGLRKAFLKAGLNTAEVNGATTDRRAVEDAFQSRPALFAEVRRLADLVANTTGHEQATHVAALNAAQAALNAAPQVILAQLQAAGQALTLTAARHAVWVQVPWSAGMLAQQRDRIRRCDAMSAARAAAGVDVQFHVLQAADEMGGETFDHSMWSVLEVKALACDAVNAGQVVTLTDESVMEMALRHWLGS